MNKHEVKLEAKKRIKHLMKEFNLSPEVLKDFEKGKINYSFLTEIQYTGIRVGVIEPVERDERYFKAIKEFEKEYDGYIVYHAVKAHNEYGEMLSLLYVSNDPENWEGERPYKNYVGTYTINFTYPGIKEFGDIVVKDIKGNGALLRIA